MTIEEKAKAYDEALERTRGLLEGMEEGGYFATLEDVKEIFPELAESEDERIIKWIIDDIRYNMNNEPLNNSEYKKEAEKAIAWLEKQGQQDDYDDNIITRDDEILQAISIGLTDAEKDLGWSDFGGLPIEEIHAWLEKQGEQKPKWTDEDEERLQSCIIALQGKGLMGGVDTMDSKWLKSLKQRIHVSSAKTCKNDTLLDLLHKMPSCITLNGIDYHFVLKKTIFYKAFYEGEGEGSGKVIFWVTAYSPIDLLTEMLEKLKKEGLLE